MDDLKFSKLQLWGAAIPLNRLNCPFLYDVRGIECVGIGLTLALGRSSIETAFVSGTYLAQHIIIMTELMLAKDNLVRGCHSQSSWGCKCRYSEASEDRKY